MSTLATRSLDNALNGLHRRDADLCLQTIADDEEINQLEKQIDKDGIDLLLRFQPVASDLRRVVSAMKLSTPGRCSLMASRPTSTRTPNLGGT